MYLSGDGGLRGPYVTRVRRRSRLWRPTWSACRPASGASPRPPPRGAGRRGVGLGAGEGGGWWVVARAWWADARDSARPCRRPCDAVNIRQGRGEYCGPHCSHRDAVRTLGARRMRGAKG